MTLRRTSVLCFAALFMLLFPQTGLAQDEPLEDMPKAEFVYRIQLQQDRGHHFKVVRCRYHTGMHFKVQPRYMPADKRDERLAHWRAKKVRAKSLSPKCLPTTPEGIIRYVFPAATENAAVSVAECESHLSPTARNPSGASGLFQLMPGHWLGSFDPFDPWANTRYAYRLSDAGYNWSHWVCKP